MRPGGRLPLEGATPAARRSRLRGACSAMRRWGRAGLRAP